MTRLILMTLTEFAPALADVLHRTAPALQPVFAATLADLEAALAAGGAADAPAPRVLSVGADVIVPRRLLEALPGPAYNLHPGPPEYPGLFPSVFALYEDADAFGVTLHEMAPRVDSGTIVHVERFAIDPRWDRLALDTHTFAVMMRVVAHAAPHLADAGMPLPASGDAWAGRRRTRKDFDALCRLPPDYTAEEFARRLRAAGEGPDHALTVLRGGEIVRLDTGRRGTVVRGGQRVTR